MTLGIKGSRYPEKIHLHLQHFYFPVLTEVKSCELLRIMASPSSKRLSDLSNEIILEIASYLSGPDKVCFALTKHLHYDVVQDQLKSDQKHKLVDICPKPKKPFLNIYGKSPFEVLMRRLVVWMPDAALRNVLMNTNCGNNALRLLLEWPSKGHYSPYRDRMVVKLCKWQKEFDELHRAAVNIAYAKKRIAGCHVCRMGRIFGSCRTCREEKRRLLEYYGWKFTT